MGASPAVPTDPTDPADAAFSAAAVAALVAASASALAFSAAVSAATAAASPAKNECSQLTVMTCRGPLRGAAGARQNAERTERRKGPHELEAWRSGAVQSAKQSSSPPQDPLLTSQDSLVNKCIMFVTFC